jgi:hypothetical protein
MNFTEYKQFLSALNFVADDRVCIGYSSGTGDWQNEFLSFADLSQPEIMQKISAQNEAGKNVYISMAPFLPAVKQRTKANVEGIRHVFIEKDSDGVATLEQIKADVDAGVIPEPLVRMESSSNKIQVIWAVDPADFVTADGKPDIAKHEAAIDALQHRYQSDPQSTDSARVLRIAGTVNNKYQTKPAVKLLSANTMSPLYAAADFKVAPKPITVTPVIQRDARNLIPHGQIYGAVMTQIGKLRNEGYPAGTIESLIPEWVEYNCAPPIDWDKISSYTKAAHTFAEGDPRPQVLFNGKPGGSTVSDEFAESDNPDCAVTERELKAIYAEIIASVGKIAAVPAQNASTIAAGTTWRDYFRTPAEMEQGSIRMLIEGILPEGITYIGGLAGDGKTWFALSMVRALTTGELFLGKYRVPQCIPVIYLVPEVGDRAFRSRLEKFHIPNNDPERFLCRTISMGATLRLDDPVILEAVRHMNHPVVFLDTSIRFSTANDENSASQNKKLVDDIAGLRAAGAIGVVGLHHSTKSMREEAMSLENVLRGSGDLSAMCDTVYGVKTDARLKDRNSGPIEFDVENVKPRDLENPPAPFRIALKYRSPDGTIRSHIDDTGDVKLVTIGETLTENANAVEQLFITYPQITVSAIVEKTSIPKYRVVQIAEERGYYKPHGSYGKWMKETPEETKERKAKAEAKTKDHVSVKTAKRLAEGNTPAANAIDLNSRN